MKKSIYKILLQYFRNTSINKNCKESESESDYCDQKLLLHLVNN